MSENNYGAIMMRGVLPASANLNNYGPVPDFIGQWSRSTNTNTTAAYGFPEDNGQGILEVFAGGRYGALQRYTVSTSGNVYIRSLNGTWNGTDGPWSDWLPAGIQTRTSFFTGDLNTLKTPGEWSVTTPFTNGPTDVAGICEVIPRLNGTGLIQRYTAIATGAASVNRTWQRTLSGGTWSGWDPVGIKPLNDLGIGVPSNVLSSLDWQNFDFVPGALYVVQSGNMTNVPAGLDVPGATYNTLIRVNGPEGGTRHVEVIYSTTTSANFRYYQVRVAGATGARTFSVRQMFTSADVLPLINGGLGASTAAGGRATLGLKTAALRDVGVGANQIPDMSSFEFVGNSAAGFLRLPNGFKLQWLETGRVETGTSGVGYWAYPFSEFCLFAIAVPVAVTSNVVAGNLVAGNFSAVAVELHNWGQISAAARIIGFGR
ncbi:TPA: hypothetical protein MYQ04_004241 [Citrobacter braakii]|nr:hypothetical protein [Citrobacter braakii]